ncbi:MAG: methyltransferase domain-containing protein [Gammaproteobacteria bacterium]|nr:methyltransferase domain-containing protein [Gammaproteobacteria bacterium]
MTEVTRVTQDFLDSSQYLESSILQYESIYGEDFVSPGGRELAFEMIAGMALAPDSRVLDVGCGLGGSAFVMAADFGLQVDAIDLSRNMLALAERKLAANGLSDRVSLQWGDCLELDCSDRYDAIYSRDVFLHIADKARLFTVLNTALKPGGQLLFSDYCCARKPWSDEFSAYVQERGYILHTTDEYAELIDGAGFEQVSARDVTHRFIEILRSEIDRIESPPLEQTQRDKLRDSWRQKLERAETGHQRWGMFGALKKA